jgi:uncharacterized membrane protein
MVGARITHWLATLLCVGGFPFCLFVFFTAHKEEVEFVTEDWKMRVLPVPITVLVLCILSIYLGRNAGESAKSRNARSWELGMITMSILLILLLFTNSPY